MQATNIHIDDVMKLKELIEHAKMHSERYGDNLATFLSKHYGELEESHKQQHQQEKKEQPQSPNSHDCTAQVQVDFIANPFDNSISTYNLVDILKYNIHYSDNVSSHEKLKVFHPSKLV